MRIPYLWLKEYVPTDLSPEQMGHELTMGGLEVEGADGPWREGERRRLRFRLRNDGFGRWLKTRHKELGGVWMEIHWRSTCARAT